MHRLLNRCRMMHSFAASTGMYGVRLLWEQFYMHFFTLPHTPAENRDWRRLRHPARWSCLDGRQSALIHSAIKTSRREIAGSC